MSEQQQENSAQAQKKLGFPPDLIDTPQTEGVIQKSIDYIQSGVFVHLKGAANTGKTTYARYIACLLQQPVLSIHSHFIDNTTLTLIKKAVTEGHTLIFDDCQRASKSDWQTLLPILEDSLLNFPLLAQEGTPIHQLHPRFTAIFTSNTDEAEQWSIPSTLLENCMANVVLPAFDEVTLANIIHAKAKVDAQTAQAIVYLKAQVAHHLHISVKTTIILGKVLAMSNINLAQHPTEFAKVCLDILCFAANNDTAQVVEEGIEQTLEQFAQQQTETTTSSETETPATQTALSPVVTVMLQSEVELEMYFYDEVISFMQDISDDEAEVSFNHLADGTQPDILITVAQGLLPQITEFIQKQVDGKVTMVNNESSTPKTCDLFIKISKQTVDPAQARIEKLKKLIANYEQHHQGNAPT